MYVNTLEIRNYLLKPGMLEHYIDYFEEHFVVAQEALNLHILGQLRVVGQPERFVWLRGVDHMQTRNDGLQRFFAGPVWQKYGALALAMLIDTHNVHLLRPLDEQVDLTCGLSTDSIAAALADATIPLETGLVAIDFYQSLPGKRNALIDAFQREIAPAYRKEGIQLRGCFVAEIGEDTISRVPPIQNEHEFVVVTAYESEEARQIGRASLAPLATQAFVSLLAAAPETLLLRPTLRSPLRYLSG